MKQNFDESIDTSLFFSEKTAAEKKNICSLLHTNFVGFLRGGVQGGGSWGTLRIPAGKIGEP